MSEQITELQLAKILVEALDLEDLEASEIQVEADLFGTQDPEGLGLDSIDALEISLAVAQNFGVQLKADDENNQQIFANLKSLTAHINQQRK
ncbi:phosphopantetheine-binding protein [Agaribacterium sp. ZY112]|uniref:phosphopantetheine-binding protein n=1 Tax=Agaribacterium sp. ZY112 TaxID=3233574 RepID=UPI0035255555